jgi:dolichol-phosphate mannosyltransferase
VLAEKASRNSPWSAPEGQQAGIADLIGLAPGTAPAVRQARVCVLIPTRSEVDYAGLLERPGSAPAGLSREVLFVDDSDGQAPEIEAAAAKPAPVPARVLHRAAGEWVGGLGGEVIASAATSASRGGSAQASPRPGPTMRP